MLLSRMPLAEYTDSSQGAPLIQGHRVIADPHETGVLMPKEWPSIALFRTDSGWLPTSSDSPLNIAPKDPRPRHPYRTRLQVRIMDEQNQGQKARWATRTKFFPLPACKSKTSVSSSNESSRKQKLFFLYSFFQDSKNIPTLAVRRCLIPQSEVDGRTYGIEWRCNKTFWVEGRIGHCWNKSIR
ncbi:hypothetical protein SLEP1_g58990 [Rubroshorea leprosula]|uniref:Uncharacterized protein n=1 Tax=Rubroshorea leprosula TaxID=152421 RepID=A0AAV5MRW7_9ROSI|nr:hypothetical protein SLEP1_g58913 [Rubroshorea leprosula]GKV52405.1 hypothetical protein SLEP1_g58990 [Rubroshorea leprosula]